MDSPVAEDYWMKMKENDEIDNPRHLSENWKKYIKIKNKRIIIIIGGWLIGWLYGFLWYINFCRLFNAKYIFM